MAASSPPTSERRARLISELSRDLTEFRAAHQSPASQAVLSQPPSVSERDTTSGSSFDPENEAAMSTRVLDDLTQQLPHIRTTAKKHAMPYLNAPSSAFRVNTSMLGREFQDFSGGEGSSSDEGDSIEVGRGFRGSNKNTPSRLHQSSIASPNVMFNMNDDSLYDVTATPPGRSRLTSGKSEGAERGSLRRNAQLRQASSHNKENAKSSGDPARSARYFREGKRASLAELHAQITSEEEETHDKAPRVTTNNKNTRFGGNRLRQPSAMHTPQRPALATTHSAPPTGNATAQSFMLPDLPNLTELMSGIYQDGTPVFSRSAKARSRFGTGSQPSRYMKLDGVPVPADEKAIFASLQLLKDKLADMEKERAESEQKVEDYENEIIGLRAKLQAQETARGRDSALGDSEGSKERNWRVEKTKLESNVKSLQGRLDRAEHKLAASEKSTKRITQERDNLVTQMGVAFYNTEELKQENEALQTEKSELKRELESLREERNDFHMENEDLRNQLEDANANNSELTREWAMKEAELQSKAGRRQTEVDKENVTLRSELARLVSQRDETLQRQTRADAERRKAEKKSQKEYERLRRDNEKLKAELAEVKAHREEEMRRWTSHETHLRDKIGRRDETIHQLQDVTQDDFNEPLRRENDILRTELEEMRICRDENTMQVALREHELQEQLVELQAQHAAESEQWARKEAKIRSDMQEKEQAAKDVEDQIKQIRLRRQSRKHLTEDLAAKETATLNASKARRTADRRENDTRARIFNQVDKEVRKTRTAAENVAKARAAIAQLHGHSRRVSAPARSQQTTVEDAESTTDLNLDDYRSTSLPQGFARGKLREVSLNPPTPDVTLLSLLNEGDVASLRKRLEEERIAERNRKANPVSQARDDTVRSNISRKSAGAMPRKSSLKDLTSRSYHADDEATRDSKLNEAHKDTTQNANPNQDIENSIFSQSSRRHRSAPTEMTSAFILPDITMRVPARPTLSAEAHQVIDSLAPHAPRSCTVCHRVTDSAHTHKDADSKSVPIPKPVPVSDRPSDDIDATLRPAQPPSAALATVLKQLQDELVHLKLEAARVQGLLSRHDPALQQRKRKALTARLEELNRDVAIRSDQIYALHDVLEGQKIAGLVGGERKEMDEKEIEETLQSIGIDPAGILRGKGSAKRVTIEDVDGTHYDGSEMEFEGFSDEDSDADVGASGSARRKSGLF